MKVPVISSVLLSSALTVSAFVTRPSHPVRTTSACAPTWTALASTETEEQEQTQVAANGSTKQKTLGLLTFDLDDTLYPIKPVIDEANAAFAAAMKSFGYEDIEPDAIDTAGRTIREMVAKRDGPAAAAALTHTQIREMAIRQEMETRILQRKLQACADDWATPVSALSNIVVSHARKWAKEAVSESIVQAVLNAWEMERHHAAERNLYPEVVDVLTEIKKAHPEVVIGAVTDGKANPMLMTFTLAPFFDFCMSWEDDQGRRTKFFQELSSARSNADLKWIYNAAVEKYQVRASKMAAAPCGLHQFHTRLARAITHCSHISTHFVRSTITSSRKLPGPMPP